MNTPPGSVRPIVSAPVARNTTEAVAAASAAVGAYRLADVLMDLQLEVKVGSELVLTPSSRDELAHLPNEGRHLLR